MRNALQWSQLLACGVAFMDDDHRQVVSNITALDRALTTRSVEAVGHAFSALVTHLGQHFDSEEQAMRRSRLDRALCTEHKQEHDDFLDQLRFFGSRIARCASTRGEVVDFIGSWTIAHILSQDRRMVQALVVPAAPSPMALGATAPWSESLVRV